jgi:hypothetical protein
LSCFERHDLVVYCPDCLNEYREDQKRCRPCGLDLKQERRSRYEAVLRDRPVWDLGTKVAAGPAPLPPDLHRVKIVDRLEEAQHALEELRFVGVEAWAGSDVLDSFDAPQKVGLYVRAPDRVAAEYVLGGLRAPDPLDRPPGPRRTARDEALDRGRGYLELGKFRAALRLAQALEPDPEAVLLASLALLHAGRMREAAAHAEAAAGTSVPPVHRARLLARAATAKALGHDGTPFGAGAELASARKLCEEAVRLAPRVVENGKVHAEILDAAGDAPALREEIHRLARLCPNLIALDGPWRRMRDSAPGAAPGGPWPGFSDLSTLIPPARGQ